MADNVELATGYVSLAISTKNMGADIARQFGGVQKIATKSGRQAGKGFSGSFGASVKGIIGVLGLVKVAQASLRFASSSIAEGREAQKVGAVTAQIIKSTGKAAKLTAAQVGDLATAISNKTGVDDEQIQKGANLLLTFKNVRDEVGKGNQVFDRATAAAVDLSAAGFGSIESSSKMLGKALNDPIKGITSLSRAGVTFTDQQKAQIKTLVESGKTLEAQKIIMGEVESQVGGVAKASTTATEKLSVVFGNFKEQIGTALIPVIDRLAIFLTKRVLPAMSDVVSFISKSAGPVFREITGGIRAFAISFRIADGDITSSGFPGFMERLGYAASKAVPVLQSVAKALGEGFKKNLAQALPVLRAIGAALVAAAPTVLAALKSIAGFLVAYVIPAVTKVRSIIIEFAAKALPVVIAGLKTLAGFISAQVVPRLLGIGKAIAGVAAVVLPIITAIVAAFLKEWPKIKPVVVEIFRSIGAVVTGVMDIIKAAVVIGTKIIAFVWSKRGNEITKLVVGAFTFIVTVIKGAMNIIRGIVEVVTGVLTGDWRKAARGLLRISKGISDILIGAWRFIKTVVINTVGKLISELLGKFRSFLGWASSRLRAGLVKIGDYILAPVRFARDKLSEVLGQIRTKFSNAVTAIGTAFDRLKDLAKKPIRFVVNTVIDGGLLAAFRKISGVVGYDAGKNLHVSAGFARGGVEPGRSSWRGGDTMLRGFRPGEGVTVSEALDPYEKARLLALNAWAVAGKSAKSFRDNFGFATGGLTGGSGRFTTLFASRLLAAQKIASTKFHIFQRGFRPATSYSGTSHQGDAVDLAPIRTAVVRALRQVGIAAWDRTNKGNWAPHIHGVPLPGAGHGAGSAIWQAQDYLRGGDGLGGRDNGPKVGVLGKIGAFVKAGFSSFAGWFKGLINDPLRRLGSITGSPFGEMAAGIPKALAEGMVNKVSKFDGGGNLHPGWTMAYNGTGRTERVLTAPQWQTSQQRGSGGLTVNGGIHGYTAEEVAINLEKRARRARALQPSYA